MLLRAKGDAGAYTKPNTKGEIVIIHRTFSILCMLVLVNAALAQNVSSSIPLPPEPQPVQIMLVGVFHFDQQDTTHFRVLSEQRQEEIQEIVSGIAHFHPTKVMLERQPFFWQSIFDSTYTAYRVGQFDLPANEIYQLGYRLAANMDLDRVWAIDHSGFWLGDSLRTVAEELHQEDLLDGTAPFVYPRIGDVFSLEYELDKGSIVDVLRLMNSPEYQALMYDAYVNGMARVGIFAGDDFDQLDNEIGGDLLAEWTRRNIKIYREILARTDYISGDRIVVFIGSDHIQQLRHLFGANFNFQIIEVSAFL